MASYSYSPLDISKEEIRLLTLLQSGPGEPIYLTITHELPLTMGVRQSRTKITQEHRNSLPVGWKIWETLEGRILYDFAHAHARAHENEELNSWTSKPKTRTNLQ